MKKSISVIIPNYNGELLLAEVLPSIIKCFIYSNLIGEIIVVDDCSNDNSVQFLTKNYPDIKVLENKINLGFSESVNAGVNISMHELVFILNNDVKLLEDYFEDQFKYFDDPNTFGVNGTIINWDNDELQGGGKILKRNLFKIKSNTNFYIENPNPNYKYLTGFLNGTNALIDKKKFLEIGGFCSLFSPFYVEDIELSVKALRLGYNCYYEPKSKCRHQISATIKKHHKLKNIYLLNNRNKMFLHAIHLSGLNLFAWYIQLFLETFFRLFTLKIIYLKSVWKFLGQFNNVQKERVKFRKLLKHNKDQDFFKILKTLNKTIYSYEGLIIK